MIKLGIPILFLLLSVVNGAVTCNRYKFYKPNENYKDIYVLPPTFCPKFENIFKNTDLDIEFDCDNAKYFKCGVSSSSGVVMYVDMNFLDREIKGNLNLTSLPLEMYGLSINNPQLCGNYKVNSDWINEYRMFNDRMQVLDCKLDTKGNFLQCKPCGIPSPSLSSGKSNITCDPNKEYTYLVNKYDDNGDFNGTDIKTYKLSKYECIHLEIMFNDTDLSVEIDCNSPYFTCNYANPDAALIDRISLMDKPIKGKLNVSYLSPNLQILHLNGKNLFGNYTLDSKYVERIKSRKRNPYLLLNCKFNEESNTFICPDKETRDKQDSVEVISLIMFILSIGLYFFTKNIWISLGLILLGTVIYYFSFRNKDKKD